MRKCVKLYLFTYINMRGKAFRKNRNLEIKSATFEAFTAVMF